MAGYLRKAADLLASYWLSVSIVFFMFLLTFLGTIAQVEHGLLQAQVRYFESWAVVHRTPPVDLPLFGTIRFAIPLLGGQTLMALLAVNLFFGGLWRIRKSRRTAGIIVVHIGIVFMLAAALVKHRFSDEGHITFVEGETAEEYVHYHEWEVAIWDAEQTSGVKEWLIPDDMFAHLRAAQSSKFSNDELPFEVVFSHFEPNCMPRPAADVKSFVHPSVDGYTLSPLKRDTQAERNVAGLYVTATESASGKQTQGILWGHDRAPFVFDAGGRTWAVDLRHTRFELDYAVQLDKFEKEEHARTTKAKRFSSFVTVKEPEGETKVHIQMNEPLRKGGFVLFQASYGQTEEGRPFSTLAVHRNPSDQWPLISCWIIAIGMLIAFSMRLFDWIGAQNKRRARAATTELSS